MGHFVALAFKNVFRQKKRSFTLGVNYALVAFILVAILSFSRGASRNIAENLSRASAGHITVSGRFAADGKIYAGLRRTDEIVAAAGAAFGGKARTVVRYAARSAVYYGGLSKRLGFTGVDAASDEAFRDQSVFLSGSWEEFAADPNGAAVPKSAADYFGLSVGDELVLSVRTRFGAFNTGILAVRGIYTTDNFFARDAVLSHFAFLRDLDLAGAGASTFVYVYLDEPKRLSEKRDAFAGELRRLGFEAGVPGNDSEAVAAISAASAKYEEDAEGRDRVMLTLSTLDEALGIVRSVLAAVNGVGAFIVAVMLFVIAVSVFINLRMSVNERLKEIGTMRALGTEAALVTLLFVLESVALAAVFSAAGAVLAAAAAVAVRNGPVFPSGGNLGIFLDQGRLVLLPGLDSILGTVAAVSAFAAVFSFFPARRGGSVPPAEALTKTF